MKQTLKIKKWQLLRYRSQDRVADLSDAEFLTVGKRAFCSMPMERVILPSASAIKTEAFYRCRRLKSVTLPTGNNIGFSTGVFRGCLRLAHVENADKLSVIGDRAFADCTMLQNLTLGRDLHRMGEYAFASCRSLTCLTLPGSLDSIGRGAFADCTELSALDISELRVCAPELFSGCISLTEAPIPTSWESLPRGIYRNCTAIERVEIPSHIISVGPRAFEGCTELSAVNIELGTVKIGARAFASTPNLKEVYLPHSIKSVGRLAFGGGRRSEEERIVLYVENEYMARRLKRLLFLCGSSGCTRVEVIGKSIEERKRERRRSSLDSDPVHLIDPDQD